MDNSVFIVYGNTNYECDDLLRVYDDEPKAYGFVEECENYDSDEDRPYLNEKYGAKKFQKQLDTVNKWRDNHPAGEPYDSYSVSEKELK